MTTTEKLHTAARLFAPEAREAITAAQKDTTHKDGYATIYRLLSHIGARAPKGYGKLYMAAFILALKNEGYPSDTCATLTELCGITA